MTNFIRMSSLLPNQNLSLIVNRTDLEIVYDIMKFQPKGVLSYSRENGIHCNEPRYIEKVYSFIKTIQEKQPSLVITPEGSIPYKVLEQIIEDKNRWPEIYKLWGLCMEGISKKAFNSLVDNYKNDDRLKVIIEDTITYRAHVNSLWYLFRIDEDHLCIVIQLKNNHMSDRMVEHEEDDLTKGNTIYIFDLNKGQPTKNVLLSLICADAIHINASQIINAVGQVYPLIINPQCNAKPFDERFIDSRISLFSDSSIAKQRYMVVNWAKGTELENSFQINEPGNAYYNYLSVSGNSYFKKINSDKDSYIHRMKSQILGVEYYGSDKFNIWNFGNDESVIRFFIKKDDVFGVDSTLSSNFDPITKEILIYNEAEECWKTIAKKCILETEEGINNIYISENEFLRPISYTECLKNECKEKCCWLYNDYFFGICFSSGLISEELECKSEISNRTISALNLAGMRKSLRKRELFEILVKLLEKNTIPNELPIYINNIKFEIDYNSAETGSNNIYNVTVINTPNEYLNWEEKKGIFAIIDTNILSEVESAYDTLYKITNAEIRDQIVLYYRKDGAYTIYNDVHKQSRISSKNATFTSSISSIFRGGMKYE